MPRFLVTGTRPDAPGIHEVRVEADSREEAARLVAEKRRLHIVDVIDLDAGAPRETAANPPLATSSAPVVGYYREIPGSGELALVPAALGCLWTSIFVGAITTVALFIVVLRSSRDGSAVLILVYGMVSLAVPLGLIAIIGLLRRISQKLDR